MSEETYSNPPETAGPVLRALHAKLNPRLMPADHCGEPVSDYCPGCKHERFCKELDALRGIKIA